MKILILGGTVFLGRHLVEAAQSAGHDVTLFNRGRHNPELFPQVEKKRGDRDGELGALRNRRWDTVIDTCGYVPRIVRSSAEMLRDSADRYVFISTLSVYKDLSVKGLGESSPVGKLEDETVEEVTGETYGPLKALCEQTVEEIFPDRSFIPRPGLIVGPHDPTDRFTYWPARLAEGGKVLSPEPRDLGVMYIDVRDLSEWIVDMIQAKRTGIYNAVGPDYYLSMEQFLESCRKIVGSDMHLEWVDDKFLLDQGVAPWSDLPLWLPGPDTAGMSAFNVDKALRAGLTFRPLVDTIKDTLDWFQKREDSGLRAGISRDRERELLDLWVKSS